MAKSRKHRANPIDEMFARHDGARIPGGCDHRDAYQTFGPAAELPGVWMVHVHHDDWCPVLGRHTKGPHDEAR